MDKVGNQVRFLDPATFETVHALGGFPSRVHELAISPDGARAFVPIYGDGRHGANPNPGHQIAVIDLHSREHLSTFSVAPYLAPHGMRWGPAPAITIQIDGNNILIAPRAQAARHGAAYDEVLSNALSRPASASPRCI